MKSLYKNLLAIFTFTTLITACSSQVSIEDATEDKVVINASPEMFTEAYDMAKKECLKHTKTARYITDEESDLDEVAFDCVGEEEQIEESEAPSEEDTEMEIPEEDTSATIESESETEETSAE